jgi:uncharacterized membrane protein
MKKSFLFCVTIAALFIISSCSKSSNNPPANSASVMFFNGCANAGNIDFASGSTKVNGATGIQYMQGSGYQYVSSGTSVGISITESSINALLCSGTESISTNGHYSVFAGGLAVGVQPSFVFSTDDLTAPTGNNAKVRFVNLSADTFSYTCYVGTPVVQNGLSYQTVSPFVQVPAQSGVKISLYGTTNPTINAILSNISINAGKIYTIVLTGKTGLVSPYDLELTILNNN